MVLYKYKPTCHNKTQLFSFCNTYNITMSTDLLSRIEEETTVYTLIEHLTNLEKIKLVYGTAHIDKILKYERDDADYELQILDLQKLAMSPIGNIPFYLVDTIEIESALPRYRCFRLQPIHSLTNGTWLHGYFVDVYIPIEKQNPIGNIYKIPYKTIEIRDYYYEYITSQLNVKQNK